MTLRSTITVALGAAVLASAATVHAEAIYGLRNDTGTTIFTFDSAAPTTIITGKAVTGLQIPGEQLEAIDVRPATNVLTGVSSYGNLYVINPATGAAVFTGNAGSPDGANFDMDFNPSTGLIRFVSDSSSNIRINPVNAFPTLDSNLAYVAGDPHFGAGPNIAGIAYSNNTPGTANTTLYGIDSNFDTLVISNNPNGGTLATVGVGLGINVGSVLGFDISNTGVAYAAILPANSSTSVLYSINLTTGAATALGQIGGGFQVRDITLVAGGGGGIPEPASLGLFSIGIAAFAFRRRK